MLITNQTNQDYYFGPLHLPAGIGTGTLTVDDTSATSLYLTDDGVADAINTLYAAASITVSSAAVPFPRPTGDPQILHGDGSPENLIYAGQGSMYMSRTAGSATNFLYTKTTGIHLNSGWIAINPGGGPGSPVTTLPGSPGDGTQALLTDSPTAPTYGWLMQYSNAASKWFFIGGSPLLSGPVGSISTGSSSAVALTSGPSIAPPRAGLYVIQFGCQAVVTVQGGVTQGVLDVFQGGVGGTNVTGAIPASAQMLFQQTSNIGGDIMMVCRASLVATTAVTLGVRTGASGTDTFSQGWIQLTPVYLT